MGIRNTIKNKNKIKLNQRTPEAEGGPEEKEGSARERGSNWSWEQARSVARRRYRSPASYRSSSSSSSPPERYRIPLSASPAPPGGANAEPDSVRIVVSGRIA
jgi:hypothetical protein